MIRQNQRFLTQIYVLTDALCMLVMFLVSYWVKFQSGWLSSYDTIPFNQYFMWGTVYAFAAVLIGFYVGFYAPRRRKSFSSDIWKIIQVQSLSFLGLLSMLFIAKEVHISRELLVIFFCANITAMAAYRFMVKQGLFRLRRKGYNKKFVLILGAGTVGRSFFNNLQSHPELGYEVYGFLDDYHQEHPLEYRHLKPVLGKVDELEAILQDNPIDEVIIALPLEAHHKYAHIIDVCDNAGAKTLIIPDYFDLLPARPFFDNFAGIPLINVRDIPLDELSNRLLKRTFDIVFSLIAIIIASPAMLFAYLGIKLTSPGPAIFKQERMGLDKKTFYMYKFRSMHLSDDKTANTQWTVENDPRRTKFGAFLRRTSIDELPQFFNVLRGEMSVVGPRPERPYFVEQFKGEVPKYMVKHHIRPGITGWAQTNGLRGDTSIHDRIDHDLFYIENWSFLFDLKIIIKTIVKGLVNKNAY
ncbi:undecaprenyl-phosphate glucose phosphotransferase [Paenibacillus sambharensis]|uniref:Undecaprenyl-phosphate glucose phosphotransferase n=1 Tax=Paenibacillus sambharensis TaxID=1803190 RepID=A0A2W1LXG3_9BACL|nr:undecaprenyl-phosphate glucose phosphotransferase [Paenibacillus sambharensis]PZD96391.1 undecaprenyl-phosphate glucose phosphotransferase [Paenibacillus sambharensis]